MRCTTCNEEKAEEDFAYRNKASGVRRRQCRVCVKRWDANNYRDNPVRKIKISATRRSIVQRNKAFILSHLLANPCVDCGERDIVVLEFDHLTEKHKDVMIMVADGRSLESIKAEVSKCEVVCANCHKRRTTRRGNHWRNNVTQAHQDERLAENQEVESSNLSGRTRAASKTRMHTYGVNPAVATDGLVRHRKSRASMGL